MRWTFSLLLLVLLSGTSARVLAADVSVVVLGLRSLEGDDEFANAMTDALRTSAKSVAGWRLLDRSVSMSQMAVAYNCDDIDAGCLSEISRGQDADRVIFGTVRRTAAQAKYDYEVTLSLFNGSTHSIVGTETQIVERADGKKANARQAQALVKRLALADSSTGRLFVDVNVLNSEVRLDGQPVGLTQDGKLQLETVAPGEHQLEVRADGHRKHTQAITIAPSEQTQVSVSLERVQETPDVAVAAPGNALEDYPVEPSSGSIAWLGYTLIGVGAASAVAWAASMYIIEFQFNRDVTYQNYKNAYQSRTLDACDAALNGDDAGMLSATQLRDFKSQCRTGRTFQVLQWVFLGAAVVAAGAGVYVLIGEGSKNEIKAKAQRPLPRFTLQPWVERHTIALDATLRF
jgi:hypothetical protein